MPSGITEVEKRAVIDSAEHAGAREVLLVPEPIAAAIGVGLPVDTPTGNMVVDIGGGTTEIAVIALNGIVTKTSIRVGGDEMDEAIVNYAKKAYNMLIGEQTAERIKIEIGSAFPLTEEMDMEIKGRDLVRGIPRTLRVSIVEIREALQEPVDRHRQRPAGVPRADAARAGRGHRGPRHLPDRRRGAAARPRPAACAR